MASPRTYSIEEFLGTTNYGGSSFSPDNRKVLVSSDASGIYNAYAINISDRTLEQRYFIYHHNVSLTLIGL